MSRLTGLFFSLVFSRIALIFLVCVGSWAAQAADIFYQDSEYIYRSVPDAIDVSDKDLMSRLIQAATHESMAEVKGILGALDIQEFDSPLKKVEAEIGSYLAIEEQLEALNTQVNTFKDAKENSDWGGKDMLPKALTIFIGFAGSGGAGVSVSGSLVVGRTIFIDKVDKIRKSTLSTLAADGQELSLENIEDLFSRVDSTFGSSAAIALGGEKQWVTLESGQHILVQTSYALDTAPVVIAAPAIGSGVGGGFGVRVGIAAAWWKGNQILEPEDLYGWGLAYSQDLGIFGGGYNAKFGGVNSTTVGGFIDYVMASFAIGYGPQVEVSPAKANLLFIKEPMWLLKKLGVEEKANELMDGQFETLSSNWEKIIKERRQNQMR